MGLLIQWQSAGDLSVVWCVTGRITQIIFADFLISHLGLGEMSHYKIELVSN